MSKNDKEKQVERNVQSQTVSGKAKYKAVGTNGSTSLTCKINDKETQILNGEIIELTDLEKNRLSAACTWKFEEVAK